MSTVIPFSGRRRQRIAVGSLALARSHSFREIR